MTNREKLKKLVTEVLNEITKTQVKSLKEGDKVWYWYKGLKTGSIEVEFVKFNPAVNKNWYDTATVKTDKAQLNPDKNGHIDVRISHLYTEDPEMEGSTGSKKGFLNKGVQGPRKW